MAFKKKVLILSPKVIYLVTSLPLKVYMYFCVFVMFHKYI